MGGRHAHPHPRPPRGWGEPGPSLPARAARWFRATLGIERPAPRTGLPALPLALRRGDLAGTYLAASGAGDHGAAGGAAKTAMERAVAAEEWWPADQWAHRALWHFERAQLPLEATRQARRIGDLRSAAGDPASARRYYAEAIDEARDIGAEHEQGLAALGLGQALLDLGQVTAARRLGSAAVDLLERADGSTAELEEARLLHGTEVVVGEHEEDA